MSSYTITITPDDTANASATLHVNLGASGARITELTVRAGDGDGFAPDELPGFELSRLIGAITPASATRPVLEAGTAAEPEATAPAAPTTEAPTAEDVVAEPEPPAVAPQPWKARPPAKSARAAKSTRAQAEKAPAEKAPAKKAGRRKAAAAKATASKATGAARVAGRKAAKKAAGSEREVRAYRRMPDDVAEVYRQAGGATAMANHYGVPRHTAQGWLRRLRQQGDLPS